MYLSIVISLKQIWDIDSSDSVDLPRVTGPRALFSAFRYFTRNAGLSEGIFDGVANRTVTVVGGKGNANEWIVRETVSRNVTRMHQEKVRMEDYPRIGSKVANESCAAHLWNVRMEMDRFGFVNGYRESLWIPS